jgi:hypothetical protein
VDQFDIRPHKLRPKRDLRPIHSGMLMSVVAAVDYDEGGLPIIGSSADCADVPRGVLDGKIRLVKPAKRYGPGDSARDATDLIPLLDHDVLDLYRRSSSRLRQSAP